MALFPEIDRPCPYKGALSEILEGDVCRLCKREVRDLTQMSDSARIAFLKACSAEVCVTYRFPIRATAAAALALAAIATPIAAAASEDVETVAIVTGGIKDPSNARYVQAPDDKPVPELPVIYDPKAAAPPRPVPISSKAPA